MLDEQVNTMCIQKWTMWLLVVHILEMSKFSHIYYVQERFPSN